MMHEFSAIVGTFESKLLKNCKKLIAYAKDETRREVKSLLRQFATITNPNNGMFVTEFCLGIF